MIKSEYNKKSCIFIPQNKGKLKFEDVMNFWPMNSYIYNELQEEIDSVVPLIGAGLTQNLVKDEFGTFKSWENMLTDCAYSLGDDRYNEVLKELNNNNFEEAAQYIVDVIGKGALAAYIKKEYSTDKIDEKKVKNSALSVMPQLFETLVLTTNYDKVIEEYVYGGANQIEVLLPSASRKEFVNVIRKKNKKCILYKFHGDIEKDGGDLILTKDSYNKYYGVTGDKRTETDLVRNLSFCLTTHPILFLGCGLKHDRIIDLILENTDVHHFALVACGASSIEKFDEEQATQEAILRGKELDEKNIHAIFYPRYDRGCVKVILDELLKSKDPFYGNGLYYRVHDRKDVWLRDFLSNLNQTESSLSNHIVLFGGIISDLRKYETNDIARTNIDNLNEWLSKHSSAVLYICYDSEEAAEHRAEQTNKDITPESRIDKIIKIRKIPNYFDVSVRERVKLIPITYSLTGYSILADHDLYWNIITHGRSSTGQILEIMENIGEMGRQTKANKIGYMLFALEETRNMIQEKIDNASSVTSSNVHDPIFNDNQKAHEVFENIENLTKILHKEQLRLTNQI